MPIHTYKMRPAADDAPDTVVGALVFPPAKIFATRLNADTKHWCLDHIPSQCATSGFVVEAHAVALADAIQHTMPDAVLQSKDREDIIAVVPPEIRQYAWFLRTLRPSDVVSFAAWKKQHGAKEQKQSKNDAPRRGSGRPAPVQKTRRNPAPTRRLPPRRVAPTQTTTPQQKGKR